jgi:outer membrane protein TolC
MVALGSASADQIATGPADRIVESIDDAAVRDVIEDVLERNPEIAALAIRVSAAGHRTTSIRKLPDPRAEVTAFVLPPETRVGPQRFAARISQQIPGGGKRSISEKTADFDRRALAAELQALRLAKVSETRRLLAEIRYIDEARRVLADDRATLAHFEELGRARYASGAGLQMDAVQIQTEMTRLEARMAELVERRGGLAAEVNRLRDRPGAVIAEGSTPPPRPMVFDWDDLRQLALDSRPELDADNARIQGSEAATELAAKAASPDFSVGLTYAYVDRRTDVEVPKNGQDVLGISGGISIPIWRTGTAAAVEASSENRLAAEASRRTTVAGIDRELESLRRRIPEIRRRLALLEDVLPIQSRQALSSAVSAYAAGRVDALALLDAERVLLDVRLSAARGRTDLALALIDLEAAIAAPLPTGDLS